jgi:hypothetical protein
MVPLELAQSFLLITKPPEHHHLIACLVRLRLEFTLESGLDYSVDGAERSFSSNPSRYAY